MALAPFSFILNSERMGFWIMQNSENKLISHLLFVDDIKISASSKKNLQNQLRLTQQFGKMVGFDFGFNKCALATIKPGKTIPEEALHLNSGRIEPLQNNLYKYLGTFQGAEADLQKPKTT